MARKMVLLSGDGSTPVLEEVPASDEKQLQATLTAHPDLVPIEEFGLPGPLMVVGRETSLPSGAADLVGVTRGGDVLVAEFKTGPANPDFRHSLAQAMDYGSDMWGMSVDEFEAGVALRHFASHHCPATAPTKSAPTLMAAADASWGGEWPEEERSQFIERLGANLESGAFHYAVIAQRFTPAMERTVEYLNATTKGSRFYLVEFIRFSGSGVEAFEARTVARPHEKQARSSGGESFLDLETFLANEADPDRRERIEHFLEFCTANGLVIYWGTKGIALKISTAEKPDPLSIGWIHPSGVVGWMGLRGLALGFDKGSAAQAPSLTDALAAYRAQIALLPGTEPLKASNLEGSAFDAAAEAENLEAIQDAITTLVQRAMSS